MTISSDMVGQLYHGEKKPLYIAILISLWLSVTVTFAMDWAAVYYAFIVNNRSPDAIAFTFLNGPGGVTSTLDTVFATLSNLIADSLLVSETNSLKIKWSEILFVDADMEMLYLVLREQGDITRPRRVISWKHW